MKTHFIENTNKQYSIRKDGEIIRNYYKYKLGIIYQDKLMSKWIHSKGRKTYHTRIRVNGKKIIISIQKQLRKHFPEQFINHNRIIDQRKRQHYNSKTLNDIYITKVLKDKDIIKIPNKLISNELIESKRQQLLLYRQLKQLKNEYSRKHKD